MKVAQVISDWTASAQPGPIFPALLRMARAVPDVQAFLGGHLTDPLDRALVGLEQAPQSEGSLERRVLSAIAATDGGQLLSPAAATTLEQDAEGDPTWWIHAARVHVLSDPARERAARARLADQSLPYVFPGELHPLMVDFLAAGDRVLPALHVDWTRKLSKWMAEDLLQVDCQQRSMWFWPVLGSMDTGRLMRPLARLAKSESMPPGGLGLAAAYCHRVGAPGDLFLEGLSATDKRIYALARMGAERRNDSVG